MKKKRYAVWIAAITVTLCLIFLMAGTYALFTDYVKLSTHIQAGSMDITLWRTNLTTRTLDNSTGYLVDNTDETDRDFSDTRDNVFGIVADETLVVPGCYFDAEMKISNGCDVAFIWWVEIVLNGSTNSLAEQLRVTVTVGTEVYSAYLSETLHLGDATTPNGTLAKNENSVFNVKVEFIDDNAVNNAAQDKTVDFDLIVHAVQATQPASANA